jgi:hypothetical protein
MPDVVESFQCVQCGAPLRLDKGVSVAVCEYCGSVNSLRADKAYVIKHSWMENRLSQEDALKKAREWMGGGLIMPPGMDKSRITSARLVYVPLWVMEAKAKTSYSGIFRRGEERRVQGTEEKDFYWKVLARRQSGFPVREYKVPLSMKRPYTVFDIVKGEMLNSELDEQEAREQARQEIASHMQMLLEQKVDKFEKIDTDVKFGEAELLHAPVWMMEFEYRSKPYKLAIEGTEGSVLLGEIPPADFLSGEMKLILGIAAALVLLASCGILALGLLR